MTERVPLAGVSRSAAVAVAVLMGREGSLDADTALDLIRRSHPGAHPNDGFIEQLRLFHAMGCRLDATNAQWRRHQVAQLASTQDGAAAARLNADPGNAPPAGGRDGQGMVRCRRCGRLLALMEHTIPHEHGAGGARSFGVHKQRKGDTRSGGVGQCSSLFVEPISWMGDALHDGSVSGKLACPKCAGRLGAFSWAGEQCGCGCWVTPAFQLHVSRVDILPGTATGVATHTHVPLELNKKSEP
jgi:dual specificity phosphatase 12